MLKLAMTAVAVAFSASAAHAQSIAENNGILTDASGRTLYTFTKDSDNKSNCNGGCAAAWPPFIVKEGERAAAGFSVVTRDDGGKQWAKDGKPLYYFAADVQPGDVKGDGQGGVWHVIRGSAKPRQATRAAEPYRSSYY
jgi:predicted lipoprotein with Yx(FWY)xxD motif